MGRRIHLIVCIFTVRFKHPHEHSKPLIAIPWKGPHTHRCECCSHWNVDYSSNLQSAIVRVGPTTRPGRDCQEGTAGRKAKRGGKNLAPSAWAVCAAGPLQAEPLPGILGRRCRVLLFFFFYFWFCFKCLFRAVCGCLQARSQKQSSREGYTAGAFTAGWGGPHYGSSVAVLTLTRPSGKGMFSCSGLSAASASASVASCHSPTL